MNQFMILAQIAIRNLFSKFLNIVIGGIVFVGAMLFVVGSSLLNSMDGAMSKSIIGSVAGHVQVYSAKSKEELSLFGDFSFPDLAEIPDFSQMKSHLATVDNVKSVIPMGVNGADVTYGNTLDVVLERLRKAVNKKLNGDHSEELQKKIESYKSHVRQIVSVIQHDLSNLSELANEKAEDRENLAVLKKAASPQFWKTFDADPLNHLEFLENKIAFLLPDSDYGFIAYVGTDLDSFKKDFDRMEIVDGQMVPKSQRGLLLSKYTYEHQFKLKTAQRLDDIMEAVEIKHSKIAKDPDLKFLVKQNKTQTGEIILQLDPLSTKKLIGLLQNQLKSKETELTVLLSGFFDVDDSNFIERYKFFYSEIAPLVELYRVRPGDMLTIKAYTKSGFIESVNIKVYGTFQFKGLEKSGMAGGLSLIDVMSFRDLYGYLTPEKLAEAKQLERAAGTKIIDREKAEEELFGESSTTASVVTRHTETHIDEKKELGVIHKFDSKTDRVYTQTEIDSGVVLNAAIILKDPSKIKETMLKINEVSEKNGLDLKVVTWQKAAGFIGQFVGVAKVILYLVVFIIFIVALVIINNAVMMATLQRVKEIGTMRAIGAQRNFVLAMILVETIMLGLSFGAAGTAAGAIIVGMLGHSGIPAVNEFLYFFFSGPRLYPSLGAGSVIASMIIIFFVTVLSALYPAIIATRVSPVTAMQTEE
jgi:ABC-type lipoprotein release transport system permease subunit